MNDELGRKLLAALEKQNKLQEQRDALLVQWKEANGELVKKCGKALSGLAEVYKQLLEEIADATESPNDYAFSTGEFIDKFGPRLAHLTNMIQTFSQLGG